LSGFGIRDGQVAPSFSRVTEEALEVGVVDRLRSVASRRRAQRLEPLPSFVQFSGGALIAQFSDLALSSGDLDAQTLARLPESQKVMVVLVTLSSLHWQ